MHNLLNGGMPFTTAQAADLGLTRTTLRSTIDAHRLRPVFRGVFVDAAVPDSKRLRADALELVRPREAVFYGDTVAFLLGVETARPRDRFDLVPQCIVPHGSSRCRLRGVRCKEGHLDRADVIVLEGVPVTTPVRTTVDLLRTMYRPHALAAADAMAHAGHVDPWSVQEYLEHLDGYPGVVQGRELAALIEPLTESKGESWQRLRLIDAGFPRPEAQIVVLNMNGSVLARLDLGYREQRIGTEYDGIFDHTQPEDVRHDAARRDLVRNIADWRIAVARREDIWGEDNRFECQVGEWMGLTPRPRRW